MIKVFCKAFGLYFAVQAVVIIKDVTFYGIGNALDNYPLRYFDLIGPILNFIFNGIAAWILIGKSDFVVSKIIKESEDNFDVKVNKSDLMELVIIGISLLIIIGSIPEILFKLTTYIPLDRLEKNEFWTPRNQGDILYSIFKLIVGLLTITNSRLISSRLTKIGDRSDQIAAANNAD